MQITGDNEEGKRELDNFINPREKYPVIATTSKLMTTGVDAQTCKLIVLDSNIGSMTEFKQIIGRGTRINEEYGKTYFTIMDFRNVTHLFADPAFDGDPVMVRPVSEDEDLDGIDNEGTNLPGDGDDVEFPPDGVGESEDLSGPMTEPPPPHRKVEVNGVSVQIINERVQYLDADGKIITENLTDYTKANILKQFQSLESFLTRWNQADKKKAILDELESQGIFFESLQEEVGSEWDPFDLICHVAFDAKPLTRKERAENVKKRNYFTKYGKKAQTILRNLLDKYAEEGLKDIESTEILKLDPFRSIGTPLELIRAFGSKEDYDRAIKELEDELYKTGA
jgi:type I restriction enzyme R subunit